jgi:hypothetical protein
MSYTIEYDRRCFVLPKGSKDQDGHVRHEDDLFLFVKDGCNNVQPRDKIWRLLRSGWNYSIIARVCERAGACEGRSIQLDLGRDATTGITPEGYLAMYREAIKKAETLTVARLKKDLGIYELRYTWIPIDWRDKKLNNIDYISQRMEEMMKSFTQSTMSFNGHLQFTKHLDTLDDFFTWLRYQDYIKDLGGYSGIGSTQNQ